MDGLYTTNRMIPDAPNPMIPEPRPGPSNTGIWRPPTEDFENNRKINMVVPDIVFSSYPFVNS